AMPLMIASSGCCGVERRLNISILPFRITTKSVKVPPVSTPILRVLEVEAGDILEQARADGGKIADRPLRIALPGQSLQVRHCGLETMNGNFPRRGEVFVR